MKKQANNVTNTKYKSRYKIKHINLDVLPPALTKKLISKNSQPAVDILLNLDSNPDNSSQVCSFYIFYLTKNKQHSISSSLFNLKGESRLNEDKKLHSSLIKFFKSYSYALAKELLDEKLKEGSYNSLHHAVRNNRALSYKQKEQLEYLEANLLREACNKIQKSHSYSNTYEIHNVWSLVKEITERYKFDRTLDSFSVLDELEERDVSDKPHIISHISKEASKRRLHSARSKIRAYYQECNNKHGIHF